MEAEKVINHYSEYLLKHNHKPKSVHLFCVDIKLEESEFYAHYSSFDHLDTLILSRMVDNAVELTLKDAEEEGGIRNAKNQLLTFYLTLSEVLKANRSLVLILLPASKMDLSSLKILCKSKKSFLDFLNKLDVSLSFLSFLPSTNIEKKALEIAAWVQFVSILKYWIHDDSPNFKKTDVFIEKSLKFSFELSESNVLNSMMDLGKFMMNKK
jgi:hypothetical protein